ncbi:MAG: CbiX/SirB N-terminal domain-containing protein [Gammaproteobacteria bacterium]|nr:CbiX/SirB N-terminal domain-containing protein [Gammaproteobacteria bacterium]
MQALLLIAHGSRREASNQEVRDLATKLGETTETDFDMVIPAFLELAEPDIPTGVGLCVKAGATIVTAVPYFLAAGRHVVSDIPDELDKARHQYPNLQIQQSDYLGKHERIPEILMALAQTVRDAGIEHQATGQQTAGEVQT